MAHGFADSIISGMLGWLKGFAGWVLKLFDLAGSGGLNPLSWLSNNWLKLLIVLLIAGVALDVFVWLVRWRPYWIWFRKKRIVIDDDDFFTGEELFDAGMYDPKIFGREALKVNSPKREHPVKPSTVVKRESGRREAPSKAPGFLNRIAVREGEKRPEKPRQPARVLSRLIQRDEEAPNSAGGARRPDGRESQHHAASPIEETPPARAARPARKGNPAREARGAEKERPARGMAEARASRPRPAHAAGNGRNGKAGEPIPRRAPDIFEDELFKIESNDGKNQTLWEDDVFNVANLPGARRGRRPLKRRSAQKRREEDGLDDELFHVN